jgi:protein phosphatase-4 regulatory subunit 3
MCANCSICLLNARIFTPRAELFTLFEIFKTLVLLNETLLLEQLFAPDVSLEVLGVFEYDAAVAPHNRVRHRQVVSAARAFREVVSLGNETLRQKVHQTHRMIYLKEVVLPRVLDENTMSSITSLVYFNQVEIVTHLRDDKRFVGELFHRLRTATDSDEVQALVGLLQEFCALARNLQLKGRTMFYDTMMRAGLYEATLRMLENPVRTVRLAVLDVLCGALAQNPAPWRHRAVADPDESKLGDVLVDAPAQRHVGRRARPVRRGAASHAAHRGRPCCSARRTPALAST